jgi:hypothetical protein
MRIRKLLTTCVAALALALVPSLGAFQAEDTAKSTAKKARKKATEAGQTANQGTVPATDAVGKTALPAKTVPDSEIAAAKASGKVWVNTESGVFHKSGKWYGATKQGKFMTEDEAVKAGYHASKTK